MQGKKYDVGVDWRSPQAYTIMQDAEATDFAWEFVRRNADYREDHRKLQSDGSLFRVSRKFRRDGVFFSRLIPTETSDADHLLVAGGAAYGAQGGRGSSETFSRPCHLDLSRLSSADLRQASDGWHAVVRLGGEVHRLWCKSFHPRAPIVLELLLDADFDLQSDAAHRLMVGARKAAPELPIPLCRSSDVSDSSSQCGC